MDNLEKRLFLVNSEIYQGGEYLAHCIESLKDFLGQATKKNIIAFVPFASAPSSWDTYIEMAKKVFAELDYELISVHNWENSPSDLINYRKVNAVFIGDGDILRLHDKLDQCGIFGLIKDRVEKGEIKYIGSGAGSIMAGPTIRMNNDMEIVPARFDAFRFFDLQINQNFDIIPSCMGESKTARINKYHEENKFPVIGLNQANWLVVNGNDIVLHGKKEAYIFLQNQEVRTWQPGTRLEL